MVHRNRRAFAWIVVVLGAASRFAAAQSAAPQPPVLEPAVSKPEAVDESDRRFYSPDDGRFDVSGFLDEKYGFLPIILPITEPAVGYGAAGALAFISKPLGAAKAGFDRPDITAVGGMATENGSWGVLAADVRHWLDDRLQTVVGVVDASVNLDFHGIGATSPLDQHPLHYTLQPIGGMAQAKYRLGDTRVWAGLSYAFATTHVSFEAPAGTPGLPDFQKDTNVGGVTPSLTFDSRDNIFTPTRGEYLEAGAGLYGEGLGADAAFQRYRLTAMHFTPIGASVFLGLRGEVATTAGDVPFYMRPYIALRGVPIMRYQGDEVAQIETELRWQFYERWSVVGFVGGGSAWNDFARFDATQSLVTGGGGFRYELAKKYGIHAGVDVAFSRDNAAVYIQVGSAWMRP
jgi:hypothetical protein